MRIGSETAQRGRIRALEREMRVAARGRMLLAARALPSPAPALPVRSYTRKAGRRDRPRPYHKQKRRTKSERRRV